MGYGFLNDISSNFRYTVKVSC